MQYLIKKSAFTLLMMVLVTLSIIGQSRDVDSFHGISTSGNLEVTLQKGEDRGVDIKIIKGNVEDVKTLVKDGILKIYIENKRWLGNKTKAKVNIIYTELNSIKSSASSTIMATEPLLADHLNIKSSSGSNIRLEVNTNTLGVKSSSGSSIKLKGTSDASTLKSSSGSSINASELISKTVNADVSSGGSIKCHATQELEAEASSGGLVKYLGDPEKKDIRNSSGGKVRPQE